MHFQEYEEQESVLEYLLILLWEDIAHSKSEKTVAYERMVAVI